MNVLVIATLTACANLPVPVDVIEISLTGVAGDTLRGRDVFVSREAGHCVLCHSVPGVALAGNVGPPMQGVGARLSTPQLRLRVVDITRLNPDAAMPAFHRREGLNQVAARYAGSPVLSAQQVEDVVAFLGTLK